MDDPWDGILDILSNPDDDGTEPGDDPDIIISILERIEARYRGTEQDG